MRSDDYSQPVREVGLELGELGIPGDNAVPFYQAIAADADSAWSVLATMSPGFLRDSHHETTTRFNNLYEEVAVSDIPKFRELFAMSKRMRAPDFAIFQGRQYYSLGTGQPDWSKAHGYLRGSLGMNVEDAIREAAEGVLTAGMYKSRFTPMPGALARYAVMFYVSSLVRYKPSALDPIRQADAAWLLDSFTKEAPLEMLVSAFGGIMGKDLFFEGAGYRV